MFFTKEGQKKLDEKKKKQSLLTGNKNSMGMVNARLKPALKMLTSGKDDVTGKPITASDKKTYVKDVMNAVNTGLIKQSNAKVRAALKGATK